MEYGSLDNKDDGEWRNPWTLTTVEMVNALQVWLQVFLRAASASKFLVCTVSFILYEDCSVLK